MALLTLMKYDSGWKSFRKFNFKELSFTKESKSEITEEIDGIYYDQVPDNLLAVFSYEKENYLYLNGKLIGFLKDISVKFFCGEREEKSWLKVFKDEKLIFHIVYSNAVKEPYIDFVSGFEDWDVINWAYHFALDIKKVKEDPRLILFSNSKSTD